MESNTGIILDKVRASIPDVRDHIAKLPVASIIPAFVDMKPDVLEVEDQGSYGSCTANAGCSALELMYNQRKVKYDFSRLYLYYYTRQLSGLTGDNGAYPRDIGKALNKYGVCLEPTWDYTAADLEAEPSAEAKAEAAKFKIVAYEQLPALGDKVQQIKNAVAQGIPVLLTMIVHHNFMTLSGSTWKNHWWNTVTSAVNPVAGAHEVLVIGYDDATQRLLVENSWGPNWGDGGFFGMPYSFVNSDEVGELWVLTPNYNAKPEPVVPPLPPPSPVDRNDKIWLAATGAIFIIVIVLLGRFMRFI
jgi:C1A family cysteine protease